MGFHTQNVSNFKSVLKSRRRAKSHLFSSHLFSSFAAVSSPPPSAACRRECEALQSVRLNKMLACTQVQSCCLLKHTPHTHTHTCSDDTTSTGTPFQRASRFRLFSRVTAQSTAAVKHRRQWLVYACKTQCLHFARTSAHTGHVCTHACSRLILRRRRLTTVRRHTPLDKTHLHACTQSLLHTHHQSTRRPCAATDPACVRKEGEGGHCCSLKQREGHDRSKTIKAAAYPPACCWAAGWAG